MSRVETRKTGYTIREYRAADLDGFLDLHAQIFEPDYGRTWFAWKYEDNPYIDHVPVFVAENDGDVVGARPFFALDMSVGGDRRLALQPGDTMVHPDHRRQGLFTRMTEAAIEKYADGEPSFFFNFPNRQSGPGYLNLGWEKVTEQSTYYRIQDPSALGLQRSSATWRSIAGLVLKPLLSGYNGLSTTRPDPVDGSTIRTYESVPSTVMAAIATERPQSGIHVLRDERFYGWRFDSPERDYVTYVAEDAGEPVAGMVVGTSDDSGRTTRVTDVAPLPEETPSDGLEALLHRVVREHADSDVVAAPPVLPESTVRGAGFHRDDRPPLSYGANQTTHVVRSLTGDWNCNGVDITAERNWRLTFSERDTS